MANLYGPRGLSPARYVSGAPYNGAANAYSTASGDGTALWIGDLVKFAGTSQLIGDVTYLDVAKAATTDVVLGAVVAVDPVDGTGAPVVTPLPTGRLRPSAWCGSRTI